VRDGEADDPHVGFFVVAIVGAGGELFGNEDVLALTGETVGDPHPGEFGHAAGEEAGLFAQLAAREFFGIVDFGFPSTLRQLERALADGVAVLFDEPDVIRRRWGGWQRSRVCRRRYRCHECRSRVRSRLREG
jgi:hypothetical protein